MRAKMALNHFFDDNHVDYNGLKCQEEQRWVDKPNDQVFIFGHYCIIIGHLA